MNELRRSARAKLEAFMEWLTPAHLARELHARKRVRLFLFSHLFGPLLGLQVPAAMALMDPNPWPHVAILAASIAGFWVFLPLLKCFPRSFTLWAHLSITNLNFAVLWGSYFFGGASSPFLMWYMLLPLLAFFYLGSSRFTQLLVFAQIALGLGCFLVAHMVFGHAAPMHIDPNHMMAAGIASTLLATTYAFFMAVFYSSVVDSQSGLLKEVARHEATLKALTQSKEQMDATNRALMQANQLVEARNAQLESVRADLEHMAMHDALTGLPNRRFLDKVLDECAASPDHTTHRIALMHIDLDWFKQINDTLGHAAGDAVLVHVAHVLQEIADAGDFIARIGGDEFVVLCRQPTLDRTQMAMKAHRIIAEIRQPIAYEHHLCRTGASVGIAMESSRDTDLKQMLMSSDMALYEAKNKGKNGFEFFTRELQQRVVLTKQLADDILRGIEQNEFTAFFQPKFDAKTRQIVGAEALARWLHPVQGTLVPGAFLRVADELNVVAVIDRLVFDQALVQFNRWQDADLGVPALSLNVSMRRLNDHRLIDGLRNLKFEKGSLSFELLESIFLDNPDENISSNIEQLKELGIDIEIDDFGTGHASMIGLFKLQPKRIKLDRQFVTPIVHSAEKRRMVSAIIDMAKAMNIGVVAEGVESLEQARVLEELGCESLQGYAFSRPLSALEFEAFVRAYPKKGMA